MQQRLKQIENAQFQTILRFTKACNTYDQFMKLPASELAWFTWKLDYQNSHMAAVFVLHRQSCIRKIFDV
jgi:hypothetical protein